MKNYPYEHLQKTKSVDFEIYEVIIEPCFNEYVAYHWKNKTLCSRIHIKNVSNDVELIWTITMKNLFSWATFSFYKFLFSASPLYINSGSASVYTHAKYYFLSKIICFSGLSRYIGFGMHIDILIAETWQHHALDEPCLTENFDPNNAGSCNASQWQICVAIAAIASILGLLQHIWSVAGQSKFSSEYQGWNWAASGC